MRARYFILLAFAISAGIIPFVIKICNKFGIYDYTGGRKIHNGNIPRMGGIGFVFSFLIVSLIFVYWYDITNLSRLIPLLIAGLLIFIFGIIDDFLTLKARFKLIVQVIAVLIVVLNGFEFTRFGPIKLGFMSEIITFLWILGVINSFNLIDGIDGLCGGLSFIIIVTYGILFFTSSLLMLGLCFIFAGAIAGFLLYNKPKAKIFMGDGGSQFLGFMIAVLPLFRTASSFEYNKMPIAFLLTAIPIFDTFAAIWRRIREHRSIMSGDQAHTHHKLLKLGYSTWGVLIILYSLQIFLSLTCIISAKIDSYSKGSIILLCGLVGITLFFIIIHYTYKNMLLMLPTSKEHLDI